MNLFLLQGPNKLIGTGRGTSVSYLTRLHENNGLMPVSSPQCRTDSEHIFGVNLSE